MKMCFSILFVAFSHLSFGQIHQNDTSSISDLIQLSKANQWADPHQSWNYANQALIISRQTKNQKGIASALVLRGFSHWALGDNDLVIKDALEALEIAQKEKILFLQAESYHILARGYMDFGERRKSLEAIQIAESLADKVQDWEQLCGIYNLKGVMYFIENRLDSARYYYNKAYEIGSSHSVNPINFARIISNIGECYLPDDTKLALTHFNTALELAKKTGNRVAEASIGNIIGRVYLQEKKIEHAETYLQASLKIAQSLGLKRAIRQSYAGIVDVKLAQGKGDEAVVYLRKYYFVRDSLLNTSKMRQIVELEAKQTIELLARDNKIKTIWRNLLIAAITILMVASFLTYRALRYKETKNKALLNVKIDLLTSQNKELAEKYNHTVLTTGNETLESQDQRLLKRSLEVVERNISDPLFGVEKMAEELGMSRANLHRRLKSASNFSPSDFIRNVRLKRAATLLENKVDNISQIGQMVGFDDASNFTKVFKKMYGVNPSEYADN